MPCDLYCKLTKTNSLKAKYAICSAQKGERNEPRTVCDGRKSMTKREGALTVSFTELHSLRHYKIQCQLAMSCLKVKLIFIK